MKNLREEIDRELSGFTFESIQREFPDKLPERKGSNMKFSKRIIAIAAAAAVAAGSAVTVGALNDWDYGKVIRTLFPGSSPEQQAVVSDYVVPDYAECLESTLTEHDIRIDGIIFDGYSFVLSLNASRKDGAPYDPDKMYRVRSYINGAGATTSEMQTGVEEDGSLSIRYQASMHESDAPYNDVAISFSELREYDLADRTYDETTGEYFFSDNKAVMLDEGTVTVKMTAAEKYRERVFTLTDSEGDTMEISVTPLSIIVYNKVLAEQCYIGPIPDEETGGCIYIYKPFSNFREIGNNFEMTDSEGNVILSYGDVGDHAILGCPDGRISIRLRDPIDADNVSRIVWDNYEYNG